MRDVTTKHNVNLDLYDKNYTLIRVLGVLFSGNMIYLGIHNNETSQRVDNLLEKRKLDE